jgi:tRNA pseudouridine32 synthase/23S rRNA pseudouridine746 synthase
MHTEAHGIVAVYADDAIVVLNKPSGLLAVPGKGEDKQDCLSTRVQAQYADALVVHRLDMATSGLMIMARSPAVQRTLNDAFATREVHKRYVAVVDGLTSGSGDWLSIDLPILVDWPNRPLRKIDAVHGKPSITRWRRVASDAAANTSRLELDPLTGRSHQLRIHLQSIGHPILGDGLYAPAVVAEASPRLLLHATELALRHPLTGFAMHWHCAPDF